MTDAANIPILGMLSCLTHKDEESAQYISHCLNLDIMEFGKTPDEAWNNLKVSIKHYIEHCYTNFREGFAVSAGREEWHRFGELLKKAGGTSDKVETIDIDLKSPLAESEYPIWMQGLNRNDAGDHVQ